MIRRADPLIIMSRSRSFWCGEFEPCSSLQRQNRQIEVETGCFGSSRCRDEQKKWGQCHPVSLTMQGWEGISLTYITVSRISTLNQPISPVPLHHPRCSPSGITKLLLACFFFSSTLNVLSLLQPIISMKIRGGCWRGGLRETMKKGTQWRWGTEMQN